jgi:hypothetical protein
VQKIKIALKNLRICSGFKILNKSKSYNLNASLMFSIEVILVDFYAKGQLLIIYSAFVKYLRKNGNTMKALHQPFIDLKKAYDSVRREVLYNIFIEFGILFKLVRLIKMCLNETYSRVRVG